MKCRSANREGRVVKPSLAVLLLAVALTAGAAEPPVIHDVEGSDGAWQLEIRNPRYSRPDDVRIAPHLGREEAILQRANTHAFRAGLEFVDGTIEFGVAPTAECHFIGWGFAARLPPGAVAVGDSE